MKSKKSFKIILLGDPTVGKTSIRRKFMGESFQQNHIVTLGADFAIKRFDGKIMQIWDLAGQSVYSSIRAGYYTGAQGLILTFDITNPNSFTNLHQWLSEVMSNRSDMIPIMLIGNKADLRIDHDEHSVGEAEASKYANDLSDWSGFDVRYLETSAKTGKNIDLLFTYIAEEIDLGESVRVGA